MSTENKYMTFLADGGRIINNGGREGSYGIIRDCLPDAAIVPVEDVPENWRDMTVENGRLVPASVEVLEVRREAEKARKAEAVRRERNALLAATDRYMIPDFPITEQQREYYRAYRQYLRDLTESATFPEGNIMTFEEYITG